MMDIPIKNSNLLKFKNEKPTPEDVRYPPMCKRCASSCIVDMGDGLIIPCINLKDR